MKPLDKGTFGNTKACHILIEKLNQSDKKTQKIVLNIIQKYTNTLIQLNGIQDRTIRINMAKIYRNHTLNAPIWNDIPSDMITFLKNILSVKYSAFQKQNSEKQKFPKNTLDHMIHFCHTLSKGENHGQSN